MERQLAPTLDRIQLGHVERYRFACTLAKGRILDAACGCGYGSKMLEDAGCRVVGVDIDNEAIQYARNHWGGPGYLIGDILDIPWAGRFDWIIAFEIIEHLSEPLKALKILRQHGSNLIASTPNETYYPFDPKKHAGEVYPHLRHYTSNEFEESPDERRMEGSREVKSAKEDFSRSSWSRRKVSDHGLRMIRFYLSSNPQENAVIEAAYEGCPEKKLITNLDDYKPSEIAVVMGVYKKGVKASYPRGHVIREQHLGGNNVLILETGYINRGVKPSNHYAFGWNGLNGRADFRNRNMPSDRAEKFAGRLHPWKEDGDYILLCGQVPWDASVDFTDHVKWLHSASEEIRKNTRRPVVFRPHPLARIPPIEGCGYSLNSLEHDLDKAWCAVNFNSNSGVDSILHGVPVFTYDIGSMVYSISKHDWDVEHPHAPDRTQWFNDICYAQWTCSELASGEAWRHILKPS